MMMESERALELMEVSSSDQRRSPRRSVHAGGTLSAGSANYVAWIKDINESGICLFTKHQPILGETVRVELNAQKLPSYLRKIYDGTVVRVQDSGPGAAVVAIIFDASKVRVA